ncbi:Thermospermine synthase ACAULIS5, partial [Mucuna pruriens]
MGEALEVFYVNGFPKFGDETEQDLANEESHDSCWYEEVIDDDLKWSFALNSVIHRGISDYQEIALLDTKRFGKALMIDGKMQSAEMDEFIYHECLIHPPLLCHPNPKSMFIMGGGEGSAAREALKHKSMERVIMCDIDQEVVDFCKKYLIVNKEAFVHKKLDLVINDAKAELEKRKEKFDIIVGDLADPVEGGPCYQLYTKSFYQEILKPKLNENGIFVTQLVKLTFKIIFISKFMQNNLRIAIAYLVQAGPADVMVYTTHVPSFADTWGWVMASDQPLFVGAVEMDNRIKARINGELLYLTGHWFQASATMNKALSRSLKLTCTRKKMLDSFPGMEWLIVSE